MSIKKGWNWSRLFAVGVAVAMGCATSVWAAEAPPERMTYQGFLVDGNGNVLGAGSAVNYNLIFRIYDAQTGGTNLWGELQNVTVDEGNFSVLLGEGGDTGLGDPRPALSSLFTGATASERYISVTVKGIGAGGADVEILPRLRLVASPYAFMASHVPLSSVGSSEIADGSIASADIADGTIISADIATGSGLMPSGGIIMWSGSVANIPAGWALCNGANGTPDLRDRFILSVSANENPGVIGGSHSYALTVDKLPKHVHSFTTGQSGPHTHDYLTGRDDETAVGGTPYYQGHRRWWTTHTTSSAGNHSHTGTTDSTGSEGVIDNRPAYYKLAFIMKL